MHIDILEAEEKDLPVVQNLIRFYIYDMSEFMGWNCPETGLFGGCDDLPEYWGKRPTDPRYRWPDEWKGYPFVVRVDGHLAGCALIKQLGEDVPSTFDVGEFFILRKYRGKGVGKYVAHSMFDKFVGNWEVRELPANKPAQAFWRKVISDYTDGNYTACTEFLAFYGCEMVIQRFSNEQTR